MTTTAILCLAIFGADPQGPATIRREITVDGRLRSFRVHVPAAAASNPPLPVVLVLHGAAMNGQWMMWWTGLNQTAGQESFIAVYPDGTGFGPFLSWNAGGIGGLFGAGRPDDVKFLNAVLDDVSQLATVDPRRIYVTGMSNGGMMSYRMALASSDRIAAIAPIAGTMAEVYPAPSRPIPIIHFHGTEDTIVPPTGPQPGTPAFIKFLSVEETLKKACEFNGCDFNQPRITPLPDRARDGTTVTQTTYGPGENQAEVVLITIAGGGHTWPGAFSFFGLLGRSTRDISANAVIWEFFENHPLPMP